MSANVENMFSVKSTPWHGLGHVLQQAPNSAEAIKLAGLDWAVECAKVYDDKGGLWIAIEYTTPAGQRRSVRAYRREATQ